MTRLLACRPVLWGGPLLAGLPATPIYSNSIKSNCEDCQVEVYVGPKQKALMEEGDYEVACFQCAITIMDALHMNGDEVVDLGNREFNNTPGGA